MTKNIDPKTFDLPSRTALEQIDARTIAVVMDRKSRIIMADGRKILAKAEKIRQQKPAVTVVLKTSAPVCSKTIQFLESEGIAVAPIA